jgi:molybdate transport system substrate-binding protein
MARKGLLLVIALVLGCGADATRGPLRVAAAASLTDVLEPIAERFEQSTGTDVELRFGGSSTLARQIEDGAPTDVFVSADPRWVTELLGRDLGRDRQTFATNVLVVIVPAEAEDAPRDLAELAALPHLALAGAEVPAGAHARRALEREHVLDAVGPRIVSAPDVRGALAWVASGEADAGLVYATDARVEPRVRVAFEIETSAADPIVYEALALGPDDASAFLRFLGSDEAQRALQDAGFGPPP